jgi:maltose-binding protein MalE
MITRSKILSLLAVFAILVAACQPAATPTTAPATQPPAQPTEPPAPEATEAPEPTEAPAEEAVTITIWHGWRGDYVTPIQEVFDAYTAEHPNVTIELSNPENLGEAATVAIPAGEGPDIFAWANDVIGTQALAGNIVALDDYGVDQAFLESVYEPASVNGVVWQGQIWGLPETQEGIALVYNTELVTEEFLPGDPSDFDERPRPSRKPTASRCSATRASPARMPITWRPYTSGSACRRTSTTRATPISIRPRQWRPASGSPRSNPICSRK